ncbi:hypothetical protein BCR37DRAFT_384505 [Protomyces lactucae-debilis]|uniref:Uncharacterized protein n=1 Tax=Protomyces lactucae-debilis TaxID=2754530 RepID=A0A1Y2ET84_PROLT|nr:uncharacterized protein BCR37DRAFT_384505 [Protomyces lactucae-debilis]ORY74376.1 hypothetical protein BCR37DRAFT_384505 [Protomyces lactucae-debilis]
MTVPSYSEAMESQIKRHPKLHRKAKRAVKQFVHSFRFKDRLHLHRKRDDRPLLSTETRQGITTIPLPAAPSITTPFDGSHWPSYPVDQAKRQKLANLISEKLDEAEARGESGEEVEKTLREEVFTKVLKSSTLHLTRRVLGDESENYVQSIGDTILGLQARIDVQMKLFLDKARKIMPSMTDKDLKRAATNVWPCLCFQLLCDMEPDLTDPIVGMSMLYPLTDDLVDDPKLSKEQKASFLRRFGDLVATGKGMHDGSQKERDIWNIFRMIEKNTSRLRFPLTYRSLNDLLTAQADSRVQFGGNKFGLPIPSFVAVWEVTVRKGALSILSDAYIVKGRLTDEEASFAAHFGALTQYLNDGRGLKSDLEEGQYTPFNMAMTWGPDCMDTVMGYALTHFFETFSHEEHLSICRQNPKKLAFMATMFSFLSFKLFEAVAINQEAFTRAFLDKIEEISPLPLDLMQRLWSMQYKENSNAEILPGMHSE